MHAAYRMPSRIGFPRTIKHLRSGSPRRPGAAALHSARVGVQNARYRTTLAVEEEADRKAIMDILLIDDEASLRRHAADDAGDDGPRRGRGVVGRPRRCGCCQKQRFDVAFLDLRLGREAGMDLLPALLRAAPDLAVVVVTAYATIASAVEAMRRGAFDYLPKPFTPDDLRVTLERWRQMRRLRQRGGRPAGAGAGRRTPRPTWRRSSRPCGRRWTWRSRRRPARRRCCCAARAARARACWRGPCTRAARGPAARS